MPRIRPSLLAALTVVLLTAPGCRTGPPSPQTYPVKGKVTFRDGKPMTAGLIEFRSTADPALMTNGQIQADGTFTLTTHFGRDKLPGAIEGEHKVSITPKVEGDQTHQSVVWPIAVPQTYKVKPDGSNDFTIVLDRPKNVR
jgi:hypothetical protein